jgi:hypothetical protein
LLLDSPQLCGSCCSNVIESGRARKNLLQCFDHLLCPRLNKTPRNWSDAISCNGPLQGGF